MAKKGRRLKETAWPAWWDWELDLSPHLLKRMIDRRFSELELREMLENASGVRADTVPARWIITARHGKKQWEIIVEPDDVARLLVVITAYPIVRGTR